MKKTILSILIGLLVVCFAGIVSADGIETGIYYEVDVSFDDDVEPGDSFDVEVEVTNIYNQNGTYVDIEDINVEVVIKDIDDSGSDDLDDDDDIDDLEYNVDDSIDFEFEIPLAVDDQSYDIYVTVEGDDENNGTRYTETFNFTVNVEKKRHKLMMKEPVVNYETLKCSRTTEVSVTLWNIGTSDEDVEMTVYNTELDISEKSSFDLDAGDDEDDIKTRRSFVLDLADAAAKTYTFYVKAEYDDGDERETEPFTLKVEDCPTEEPEEEEVTIVEEPTTPVITTPAVVEEETFMDQYGAALLLGLAYLVVIIVGVVLVIRLKKR
ncbi:hypothetical protein CEE44_00510 [Candidatus Woesearchaeota archaeon B3_Woes]|nr:MAG: hypothetical protein CEE44_00510 [Candidatus Woesearchaeota archaeon B3_Woes]